MLDSIRSHRRWLMIFMLLLIFPSFIFTGIYGFTNLLSEGNAVAKLAGTPITVQEFEQAQRERIDQMRQMFGGQVDVALLDTPQSRAATLDSLLSERAVLREAEKNHFQAGSQRMRDLIAGIPAFQREARFDYPTYKSVLSAQGLTEASFEARVAADLRRQGILSAVAGSSILPKAVSAAASRFDQQERDVRLLEIKAANFSSEVNVSEASLQARYAADQKQFETPETVKIDYLVLTLDDVAKDVSVGAEDISSYYESNKKKWGTEEQRRASHILFTTGEGGTAASKVDTRSKAEAILAKLRANPASFAALAKEQSKDPGSASNGGDLGFFGRNMMVKPFEDAAFALAPGQISELVESDFGVHIIRLTEVKPAQIKSLSDVRGEIENELRRQLAQKSFAEKAEQFTNLVFEQSESLQPAAERFKLRIQSLDRLERRGIPAKPGAPQIFGAKVTGAVFSPDAIDKRRNTAAIDVGQNTLVSARVVEHRPTTLRPFEAVRDAVLRPKVEQEEALRLAREAGEARIASLRQSGQSADFGPLRTVSRRDAAGLSSAAVNAVLRAQSDKLPAYVGLPLDGSTYAVFEIVAVRQPVKANVERQVEMERSVQQQIASADDYVYLQALKRKYDAQILKADLVRAVVDEKRDVTDGSPTRAGR